MARLRERARILEQGTIEFFYRPRVEEQHPESIDDVQRLLVVLQPRGSGRGRVIAIGRKRISPAEERPRFWGFVDLVLSPADLRAALGAQVYMTKTRGLRHLPATRPAGSGTYEIAYHDGHSHLAWTLRERHEEDEVVRELAIEPRASYIITVANPDPLAWGLVEAPDLQQELFEETEVHVVVPAPFPPELQARFEGRRYVQIDTPEWLDHPGAELIFVAMP